MYLLLHFKALTKLFSLCTETVTQGVSGTPASTYWSAPISAQEHVRRSCILFCPVCCYTYNCRNC